MWKKDNPIVFRMLVACSVVLFVSGCSIVPKEEQALAPPLVKPKKDDIQTVAVKKKAP